MHISKTNFYPRNKIFFIENSLHKYSDIAWSDIFFKNYGSTRKEKHYIIIFPALCAFITICMLEFGVLLCILKKEEFK